MSAANRRVFLGSLLYLLCLVFIQIVGAAAFLIDPNLDMNLAMALIELAVLGVPALLVILFWRGAARPKWVGGRVFLIIPMAFVGVFAIAMVTSLWSAFLTSLGAGEPQIAIPIPETASQLWVSLLVVGLIPALCEEGVFRGVLLPSLLTGRSHRTRALLLSGLAFGLMHGTLTGIWGHVLLGFVLGWMTLASGSLLPAMLYHLTHNGVSMVITYLAPQFEQLEAAAVSSPDPSSPAVLATQAVLMIGLFIVYAVLGLLFARGMRARGAGLAMPEEQGRARWYAYLPLILGFLICAALYTIDGMTLFGVDLTAGMTEMLSP